MIGIIGAMNEEINEILKIMEDVEKISVHDQIFYEGTIDKKAVVLVKSGVGKTLSAMTTTLLVSQFEISCVINVGSAGALTKHLSISDVVVGERVAVSDFDISAFGYDQGFDQERYTFKCNKELVNNVKKLNIKNVYFGDMVSSDTFISTQDQALNILKNYPTTLCADMEAASIAMVLHEFDIPFVVIRSISDVVIEDHDNTTDFNTYLTKASMNSAAITKELIKTL